MVLETSSILFVCLGNICRSPLAEGVFHREAQLQEREFALESAGTGSWHVGNQPDPRAQMVALAHGIEIANQRCRMVRASDFTQFDLIIGMDHSNVAKLERLTPSNGTAQIAMFMQIALGRNVEVPDPYLDGDDGFELAYQMIREASLGLLAKI